MNNQQQDYLKRLTSLRDALERKASDFDDAKNRSLEAAKLGIQELRTLTDFVEGSILREIGEAFEINRFADALSNIDLILSGEGVNDNNNEFELDKIQKLVNESIPAFLGPSKRDFLKGQETIIGLNNWYNKRSLYLPEHIEGRSLGSDCVELVWDKVEGAMGYHVEMRYPNEGSFHCVYEGCETRYKLSGLCSGTRVLFRLRSVVGNGGVSEWSECVEASTAPSVSQHLCAEGKSEYEITLYWDKVDVSDGNESPIYHVEMRSKRSNGDATGFKEVYCGNENKCTVKGLESEEEYLFYVRTECGGKYISQSSVATGKTKIPTPKKFRVKTDNWNEMNLSWNPVVSKSGTPVNYIVEMKKESDSEFTELYNGERTKIRKTEFQQNTEYSFRIRSKCGSEMSEWSDIVKIRTQGIPIPSNFIASTDSWDTVNLSWDCIPSGTEDGVNYIVKMKEGNNRRFAEIYRGTETHSTKTGLKQNIEYSFHVRSVCKDCGSEWSDVVKVRTSSIPVPSNFTVKMSTWGSADLSWKPIVSKTEELVNYVVEMKSENKSKYNEIYRGIKAYYTKAGLKQNTEYSFRVRSLCGNEMSEWSNIEKVKTQKLFAPSNFRATTITSDSFTLTWDDVSTAEFYQIEVNGKILSDQTKYNMLITKGLFSETEYSIRIRTVKGNEESEWSGVVKVKTMEAPDFSECVWKECPDDVGQDKRKNTKVKHGKAHFSFKGNSDDSSCKYSVDANNSRIATKIADRGYCTIIGNAPLPLSRLTSWSIKILKSKDNDGRCIYIGVAPFDINQNEYDLYNNYEKCGWYFDCFDSTLCSGPPHNYMNKKYGLRKDDGKYIRMGDSVGVVIDTTKGELSFVVDGVNLGAAYEGISLDKPLVPCVILGLKGDSIELDISEVKESVDNSILIPSNITAKSDTWDSIIFTWNTVEGAKFYQLEFDGEKSFMDIGKINTFTKIGLLANSEHSFRIRAISENSGGKWSDVVKKKTSKKKFVYSRWKEYPVNNNNNTDNVDNERRYYIYENNLRIVVIRDYSFSSWKTIIGNTPLPLNKMTSWTIKVSAPRYNNDFFFYIGVAPSDINQGDDNNYYKCGWYINLYDLTLISGLPHEYRNKKYAHNLGKQTQTGDLTGVIMDTTKGTTSFTFNKKNFGIAYEGVPLDKPLLPCVIAKGRRSFSIELII